MMKRPTRPIDPNDAPEYEADLDAYDKAQDDAGDRERDDYILILEDDHNFPIECTGEIIIEDNNETENDNDNES